MNMPGPDDVKLLGVLKRHPEVRHRLEALADIIADGDLAPADEAEHRVIGKVRRLGGEVQRACAEPRIERMGEQAAVAPEMRRAGKKTPLAQHRRHNHGRRAAVFAPARGCTGYSPASAALSNRGCSQPLQRAVTDFGADVSFAQVGAKLREYAGVALAPERIRAIVEGHAQAIGEQQSLTWHWHEVDGVAQLVAEMDGGIVPIVVVEPEQRDRRRDKRLECRETKLALVHKDGLTQLLDGGTLLGGVEGALFDSACRAGFGYGTQVHAVGHGVPWIGDQVEQRFGAQAAYLVDFYHASNYLGDADKHCSNEPSARLLTQQEHLKANRLDAVFAALDPYAEPAESADAPVNTCRRYLHNRRHQLDYQTALARGLPTGSGEIESVHRSIVQSVSNVLVRGGRRNTQNTC